MTTRRFATWMIRITYATFIAYHYYHVKTRLEDDIVWLCFGGIVIVMIVLKWFGHSLVLRPDISEISRNLFEIVANLVLFAGFLMSVLSYQLSTIAFHIAVYACIELAAFIFAGDHASQ
ncbi:hypothetical protein [Reichenbachiella sp.]|uniref:hypothetical protein n=1 Tax=Reichenbachiella sp. TaxID=2184521 RepID=UPI003296F997